MAGAVLEQYQIAGEVGGMGTAEVQQHAIATGDRDDLHGGDAGCGVVHLGLGSERVAALGRDGKGVVQLRCGSELFKTGVGVTRHAEDGAAARCVRGNDMA